MSDLGLPAAAVEQRSLRIVAFVGLAITAARLLWLWAEPTDLYPDEAQYWLWSRDPDWGYFSKPPLVAWIIAASTALFGNGEFGVRAAAPLFHLGTGLLVYAVARRLYDARVACWSAVAFLTLPGISVSALVISTDVPLLFCWAAALYAFIRAREQGAARAWWLALGGAIGVGLYAKYAMAYFLLCAALFLVATRGERRHLPFLLGAAALAVAVAVPNILWNAAHRFVTVAHTAANAKLGGELFQPQELGEFLGSQFGVFGPILFGALLVIAYVAARGTLADRRDRMLAWFALPVLAIVTALSLLSRSNANWAAPSYVAATVLVVAWLLRAHRARLVAASVALHVALAALLMGGRDAALALGLPVPAQLDPWARLRGWSDLGAAVARLAAARPGLPVASDDREVLAALAYYARPGAPRLVKWNEDGRIDDHFDLTADMKGLAGQSVVFVTQVEDLAVLGTYFRGATRLGARDVGRRRYVIWQFDGFRGYDRAS